MQHGSRSEPRPWRRAMCVTTEKGPISGSWEDSRVPSFEVSNCTLPPWAFADWQRSRDRNC